MLPAHRAQALIRLHSCWDIFFLGGRGIGQTEGLHGDVPPPRAAGPLSSWESLEVPQMVYERTRFRLATYSLGDSPSAARCEMIWRAHILISLSVASSCCSKLMKVS